MKEQILNLTQHFATTEQVIAGVVEPPDKQIIQSLLTFDEKPSVEQIIYSAAHLGAIARDFFGPQSGSDEMPVAMIGGVPFLMGPLERALHRAGVYPMYAFSIRKSVDQLQPDGTVHKVSVFQHAGFIGAVEEWEEK